MARLAAAFGSSHSTMQFSPVENWQKLFDYIDRKTPINDYDGNLHSFDELLARLPPDAAQKLAPAAMAERHAATSRAMERLRADIQAAEIDALIIVGDDQREIFGDDCRPAIGIYYGDTIRNPAKPAEPPPPEHWYRRDQIKRLEDGADVHYPCHRALGTHLIQGLSQQGFDITAVQSLPPEKFEGHAYSFIHKRYISGRTLPVVPIFLNTYFPPNQPTPQRCLELGARIRELVASYPDDLRVGVMASGGLSHFMVNEALDAKVIEAMRNKDTAALASLPVHWLESGSSEIRNWICVTEAAIELELDWLEYVPAYRSSALTGVGLCFAHWS